MLIKKIYRTVVPLRFREKLKEYQEYRGYQNLRHQEGHVYQRFDVTQSIFVHIPKAGGISIIKSLYGEQANGFGHPTYQRFLKLFGKSDYNKYFKFTFVRNPWDRLYSAYSFLKKGGMNHLDKAFCNEVLIDYPDFESFVMNWLNADNIENWIHFKPQYQFITDRNMALVVDFVGKFENFESDFKIIAEKLKMPVELGHHNKTNNSKNTSYREVYTPEMKEKIRSLYKDDISLFDYQF
ncbi:sulfotransferase family protein [Psychroserpens sp. SPM9]|uniref:sulfotransferase family protein n=1 Tax=Psychroserpens sp. SPM9 TaxID=2975598 RepID=UPI0021A458BA|nr:sulfotransferase family protein [Psychroserpens sp. SPM9]MDG5490135.1 sulfotransferase family protein [Psychroserpens sp. SPM9]